MVAEGEEKEWCMAVERRYLLSSSLARLLQREGGPATRLIEAYFPARSDRTQLVRVEHGQASLILRSTTPDGQVSEEAVEVPHSHAEALVEVAAGTIAFDRTAVSLGRGMEGVLDRYILPQGLDLLSVTIAGDVRLFAPPLWLGPEVTGDTAFEARELAISGLSAVEEVEVTNAALEALLDTLEMRSARPPRAPDPPRTSRMPTPAAATSTAVPTLDTSNEPAPLASFNLDRLDPPLATEAVNDDGEDPSASAGPHDGAGPETRVNVLADEEMVGTAAEPADAAGAAVNTSGNAGASTQYFEPSLPDVEDGPVLATSQPPSGRRPVLRTNIRELDDGIARLARSLSPRGSRSTH
jgi:CYTH domain-containing protein